MLDSARRGASGPAAQGRPWRPSSEDALALTRLLAPARGAEGSAAIRRLHQSLGCVLQRNAADAVLAATQAQGWAAGPKRSGPAGG